MQHTLLAATAAPQMDATGCNCCTAQQLLQRSRFVGPSPDQQLQHAAGSSCRSNQRTRQLPPIRVHRAHGGVRLRPGEGSPASGVLRARARCGATWLLARAVPSCIIDARFVACIFASLVACLVARMHALLHALLHVLLHTHCCAPCCTPRCTPCCTNAWLHALPSRGTGSTHPCESPHREQGPGRRRRRGRPPRAAQAPPRLRLHQRGRGPLDGCAAAAAAAEGGAAAPRPAGAGGGEPSLRLSLHRTVSPPYGAERKYSVAMWRA